ncbi:hypothetical protein H6G97_30560 [Nostoc flagelliforme FACHB-838]|uniref:Uncharacterized protein n=1 Tax=Nostoc flagelliforme FACHB-838 TaxID=2692904 RepID=A0ABR8DWB8_9NOSO|nr:hypothetical protein [Nostoc flagelliforme]MBD2533661.1 hypothetical protein [Nostoc flagelliforme FACHB-838]
MFQAEFDTVGIGGHLYAESLIQVFIVYLLPQYCVFSPKMQPDVGGMPSLRVAMPTQAVIIVGNVVMACGVI